MSNDYSSRGGSAGRQSSPSGGGESDPEGDAEIAPARAHALAVKRAAAAVPDGEHRPNAESDADTFGDQSAVRMIDRVAVDLPDRRGFAPVECDLTGAEPAEIVAELFVRRFDDVVEGPARAPRTELFVQCEYACRGAALGEEALGHSEVEDVERGHGLGIDDGVA